MTHRATHTAGPGFGEADGEDWAGARGTVDSQLPHTNEVSQEPSISLRGRYWLDEV